MSSSYFFNLLLQFSNYFALFITENERGCTLEEYQLFAKYLYQHFEVEDCNNCIHFKPNSVVMVTDREDVEKNGHLCKDVL